MSTADNKKNAASKNVAKTNKNTKNKKIKNQRAKTLKMFSIGSVIILVVIIFAMNILFENILGGLLTFDFSISGQNSVSDETKELLDTLSGDTSVRIVGLFDEPTSLTNTPYEYIVPLLEDYETKSNGKVKVEYINPETYPSIITELDPSGVYDLEADTYVIASGDRLAIVDPYDCFTYDTTAAYYGYSIPTSNLVEYTFTNTIYNLVTGYSNKAYIVTGLQGDDSVQISSILNSLGCEVAELPVSDEFTIPDDCDLLILNGINADISERVEVQMDDFISSGGSLLVAVNFYNNTSESYDRLNQVLNKVNINIDDYVIMENDSSYQLASNGFESLVDIQDDFAAYSSSSQLRSSYARPIRETDTPYSYISTYAVASTSESATSVMVDESGTMSYYENAGQYNVAMYGTYTGSNNPPEVYVFGTLNFTSDSYISSYGYNDANVEFLRNCLRDLLDISDEGVSVAARELDDYSIDSDKATSTAVSVMTIVFMVVIPLGMVIAATIVYQKRKNL